MATKKKMKKKTSKPKKGASKRRTPVKPAKPSKKSTRKGASRRRPKEQTAKKKKAAVKKQTRKRGERSGVAAFLREEEGSRSGAQSGDLQGLSGRGESADSQSVDELLEEGNAFEANAVIGVENADLADGKEVHAHEVPEDDVPEEYLDKE